MRFWVDLNFFDLSSPHTAHPYTRTKRPETHFLHGSRDTERAHDAYATREPHISHAMRVIRRVQPHAETCGRPPHRPRAGHRTRKTSCPLRQNTQQDCRGPRKRPGRRPGGRPSPMQPACNPSRYSSHATFLPLQFHATISSRYTLTRGDFFLSPRILALVHKKSGYLIDLGRSWTEAILGGLVFFDLSPPHTAHPYTRTRPT